MSFLNRFLTLPDESLSSYFRKWMWLSLGLHVFAAFFSSGFHHYDEHFSILEFANFKLGLTPKDILPLDYTDRIRAWFQPAAAFVLFKFLGALGIQSPFVWAFVTRLFSSCLGWVTLVILAKTFLPQLKTDAAKRALILLSALIWFIPYEHSRMSSENWSGSFFFLGLALIPAALSSRRTAGLIGFLWGLSFQCRYQIGFAVASTGLWLMFFSRFHRPAWVNLIAGFLLTLGLAAFLDRWGYGQWTMTPWNYYHVNIVEGLAARFGVTPWYSYLQRIFWQAPPPLGFVWLVGPLVAYLLYPRHLLTWATFPFFIAHSVIGHKELRFLFPLAVAMPSLLALALQAMQSEKQRWITARPVQWFIRLGLSLNFIWLGVAVLRPIRFEIPFFQKVYHRDWTHLYFLGQHPFDLAGLASYFYRPKHTVIEQAATPDAMKELLLKKQASVGVFWRGPEQIEAWKPSSVTCTSVYRTLPEWAARTPVLSQILKRTNALEWTLYECRT